jgi:hypothetical protein
MIRPRNEHIEHLDDVVLRRWENEGGALGRSAIKERTEGRDDHAADQSAAASATALQRLFALQEYSLARYAAQAELYGRNDAYSSLKTIRDIASAQASRASAIGRLLAERREPIEHGGFPLRFTKLNYVSARYVVQLLLSRQRALIDEIETCLASLTGDPEGEYLARAALAGEIANLNTLARIASETTTGAEHLALAA